MYARPHTRNRGDDDAVPGPIFRPRNKYPRQGAQETPDEPLARYLTKGRDDRADFARMRVLASGSIAPPMVERARARTRAKDQRGRGQRSLYPAKPPKSRGT